MWKVVKQVEITIRNQCKSDNPKKACLIITKIVPHQITTPFFLHHFLQKYTTHLIPHVSCAVPRHYTLRALNNFQFSKMRKKWAKYAKMYCLGLWKAPSYSCDSLGSQGRWFIWKHAGESRILPNQYDHQWQCSFTLSRIQSRKSCFLFVNMHFPRQDNLPNRWNNGS